MKRIVKIEELEEIIGRNGFGLVSVGILGGTTEWIRRDFSV
jgi:hypothetical protein